MSGSASQANLTKYLTRRRPSGAHELQIKQGDNVIARYPVSDLESRPMSEVSAEITDAAMADAESQGVSCRYSAQWCDESGRVLQAPHSWREGVGTILPLDGSTASQLAQTQRHLEAMMRLHTAERLNANNHQRELSSVAIGRAIEAERRLAIIEADNAALRAQLREAEGKEPLEVDTPPSATEQALLQIATAYAQANGLIPPPPDPAQG